MTVSTDASLDGTSLTHFHGDVSQGCLIVTGNQAIAVGELPKSEQLEQLVCAGLRALPVVPLDHGNFVVQDATP